MKTVTAKIVKKGRKWYTCRVNGYSAKVLINPASQDFKEGSEVTFKAKDLSKWTPYGTSLAFEPVTEESIREELAAAKLAKDRVWLEKAMTDARGGSYATFAIKKVLSERLCSLQERNELDELIGRNMKAWQKVSEDEKAQRQKARERRIEQRVLYPVSDLPPLDEAVKAGDSWIVYTGYGKEFRIDCDDPSLHGSHLLGHEGEKGCYCYWREATADEVAQSEKRTEVAKSREASEAEKLREALEVIDTVKKAGEIRNFVFEGGEKDWIPINRSGWFFVINPVAIYIHTQIQGLASYRIDRDESLVARIKALEDWLYLHPVAVN